MDPRFPDITVELVCHSGNAFAVIGAVSRALRRAGKSAEVIDDFRREAMSGDYNHLLNTCMSWVNVE